MIHPSWEQSCPRLSSVAIWLQQQGELPLPWPSESSTAPLGGQEMGRVDPQALSSAQGISSDFLRFQSSWP